MEKEPFAIQLFVVRYDPSIPLFLSHPPLIGTGTDEDDSCEWSILSQSEYKAKLHGGIKCRENTETQSGVARYNMNS